MPSYNLDLESLGPCISERNIHWKTPVSGFPFNKVAGLQTCNFFEETPTQVFPADIAKFLKTALFIKQLRWLLLKVRTW